MLSISSSEKRRIDRINATLEHEDMCLEYASVYARMDSEFPDVAKRLHSPTSMCNFSVERLKNELIRIKRAEARMRGMNRFKGGLLRAVSIIECANNARNPLNIQLKGLYQGAQRRLPEYEDVVEDFHYRVSSNVNVHPGVTLLMGLFSVMVDTHDSNKKKQEASEMEKAKREERKQGSEVPMLNINSS